MATKSVLVLNLLDDLLQNDHQFDETVLNVVSLIMRREHVPRITAFSEEVVEMFNYDDFKRHFRLESSTFHHIEELLSPYLQKEYVGGVIPITPRKMLLMFLWYMANQESIREVSTIFDVSKSTAHNIIKEVAQTVCTVLQNCIQWPNLDQQATISRRIQGDSNGILQGCIGFVDGSHIRLASAPMGDSDYYNRKGFPSMLLQIVVDDELTILSAFSGYPGCTHDARLLRNSNVFQKLENNDLPIIRDGFIIGDSAYPLRHWLITPFRDTGRLTREQHQLNRVLSGRRQCVERAIGLLKARFRILRSIPVHDPKDITMLIMAACILHNICVKQSDNIEVYNDPDNHPNNYPNVYQNYATGIQRREELLNRLP